MSDKHLSYTDRLRLFADWLDDNPDVPQPDTGTDAYTNNWSIYARDKNDIAAAARALPGRVDKEVDPIGLFYLKGKVAGLHIKFFSGRETVCERVVLGTEKRTRQIPPADVEMIEEEYDHEIVQWNCPESLLS